MTNDEIRAACENIKHEAKTKFPGMFADMIIAQVELNERLITRIESLEAGQLSFRPRKNP